MNKDKKAAKDVTKNSSRFALFIAFMALFFTVIGITAGYKHWLRIHVKAKQALNEISTLREQLGTTAAADSVEAIRQDFFKSVRENKKEAVEILKKVEQVQKQTEYAANTVKTQILTITDIQHSLQQTLQRKTPGSTVAISPVEKLVSTRFLLESANLRLHHLHDKKGSIALLKAADQNLMQLASPEFTNARQQIARDIATLEQLELPDISALSEKIYMLEASIKPLAELEETNPATQKITIFPGDQNASNSLGNTVKNYINNSIVIHKNTSSSKAILNAEDKKRIDQLLVIQLETLRLILLRGLDKDYHAQIKRIIKTLESYPDNSVSEDIERLKQMDQTNLTPELPDLSITLNMLNKRFNSLEEAKQ
jgi:uncharacterized protein HemX